MKYIWKLENPNIFSIFISFLVIYGILYRIIIPIILKNRHLQRFSSYKNIYLLRFLSSLIFFFIIFYTIKIVLKSNLSEYGLRAVFPWIGLVLYVITIPTLLKYASFQENKLTDNIKSESIIVNCKEILKILISWFFYIAAYEMLYRGLLLYSLVPILGKWEAITLVTTIYVFDHISKDYYVALGSFIIGFVFGYIVILRNSVLESITLHYLIAITTDIIFLVKSNVNVKLKNI